MGKEAVIFYGRLADWLSHQGSMSYSSTLAWICCALSFSLLKSATMCIRGTRSISYCNIDASPEVGHTAGPFFSRPALLHSSAGGGRQGLPITAREKKNY